jgi:transcription antitermination factor NusA-like protein
MVKLPVDYDTASGSIISPIDREKLDKGLITETDIEVSRVLYELDGYYRIGDNVELVRAYDMGSFYLLLIKGDMGRLIGKRGKVLRAIRQRLGKPIRLVEIGSGPKKAVQDLFNGIRVVGISKVREGGREAFKIYLLRSDLKFLPFKFQDMKKALETVLNERIEVEFVE